MKKSAHQSLREMYKNVLRDSILKKNMSIFDAAFKLDIDECSAHGILFDKKPSQKQIDYAMEIFDKGLSLTVACVAAGVSFAAFKKARRDCGNIYYKPQRW